MTGLATPVPAPVRRRARPRAIGLAGGVAVLGTASALATVVARVGWPTTVDQWMFLAAPVGVLLAVVTSTARPVAGAGLLALTMGGPMPAAVAAFDDASWWAVACQIGLYLGMCWVVYALGCRVAPLLGSVSIAGLVVVSVWFGGLDVPMLMLMVGWWLVGAIVGSRQRVATTLQSRVDELATEQERYAAEAVRLERAQMARELHDVVAHCMTVIVIQAQVGRQLLDHDPVAASEAIDAIIASAAEAQDDIASLVDLMNPTQRPLTRGVLDEIVRRAAATGTAVEVTVRGDLQNLPPEVAVLFHRAVQELLTNALRHAPGARVAMALDCGSTPGLVVENGPAAPDAYVGTTGAGRGLQGLSERVSHLGGVVKWGPTVSGGWRLELGLPTDLA